MRIVGGKHRGKSFKLNIPKNIRPTSDFIREAIFDVLQNLISLEGTNVLDLFAGTGMLGVETLSRGASFCQFVDNNRKSIELITSILTSLNIEKAQYRVTFSDVFSFLRTYKSEKKFDLIFSDPPYNLGLNEKLISFKGIEKISRYGTIFVLESSRKEKLLLNDCFNMINKKEYGDTIVYFIEYQVYSKE